MKNASAPCGVRIDPKTGSSDQFAEHYAKHFADVIGIYRGHMNPIALDAEAAAAIAYEVYSTARSELPGALIVGTSVLYPGRVGDEFAMTRGHLHRVVDRAEMYFGLSGTGVMLMEDLPGEVSAQQVVPGELAYVPGGWIHRSVNVGSDPLVTMFCFSADAGQDYDLIERSSGMRKLVIDDGAGGWALRDNPDYVPRVLS